MQQKTISKVSDYIQTIEQLRSFYPNGMLSNNPTNNHFLFRGLSNENYELIPGIYREDKKTPNNKLYLSWTSEEGLLQKFIQEASAYVDLPSNDYFHWAEYAQHFGVPTRLLDWTSNPLVALYFACKDRNDTNAVVWVLHVKNYDNIPDPQAEMMMNKSRRELVDEALHGNAGYEYPLIYTPSYVDKRMSAQSSYFMVWGKQDIPFEKMFTDDKYWMEIPEKEPGFRTYGDQQVKNMLFSIKVFADRKQPILHELDSLGINEKTLFPGLDGIGRYIERRYRFDYNEHLNNI